MSVSALEGVWGFGPQGVKDNYADTWYRHRATMVDIVINDPTQLGVPEVGGIAVPTFPYKTGPIPAGGATIQPRLEDTLGWLLQGLLGHLDSSTETGLGTGIFDHVFTIDPDSSTYLPWMSIRKLLPRKDNDPTTDLGEKYLDCKLISAALVLPNDGPITMRLEFLGRKFELDHDPDLWVWENEMEHWDSIPVACATGGFIKIGGTEFPVLQCTLTWTNSPMDPRQEKVYGDPYLEDVTIIYRQLSYQVVVKWNEDTLDLYRKTLTGLADGVNWTSTPFTADLDVLTVSSKNMPSESEPYSLRVQAQEVMMSQQGIPLNGNQAVMMTLSGVAIASSESAEDYASFTLHNKVASYTWPTSSTGS